MYLFFKKRTFDKYMKLPILFLILGLSFFISRANESYVYEDSIKKDTSFAVDGKSKFIIIYSDTSIINIEKQIPKRIRHENKKLISAILAFPFPFGILGLHRIYLGTKPYMPFVYVGTLGGCFGILPLIDFITILIADDEAFKGFENNPKVFMWSH